MNGDAVNGTASGARPGGGPGRGVLRARLASAEIAVTAEIGPPRGADAAAIGRKVEPLRGWVDAVNITDNQGANARLSSLAGSVASLAAGVEPVMQLTCRDRNRIALQSELLSASALGVPNVLLMTGDHPRFGDHPDAKPVFDLDSTQLLWTARTMRDQGRLMSGRKLDPPPSWLIGAVENPFAPPGRFRATRLGKKVAAGAEFVQTQYVFEIAPFARWLAEVRDLGLDQRCRILAGVGPIRSLRALEHMSSGVPGLYIPEEIGRRLRGVPEDQVAGEGVRLCAEIIQQLVQLPGVSGVHVMAPGFEHGIPEILERAGLLRREPPGQAAGRVAEGAAAGAGPNAATASRRPVAGTVLARGGDPPDPRRPPSVPDGAPPARRTARDAEGAAGAGPNAARTRRAAAVSRRRGPPPEASEAPARDAEDTGEASRRAH